VVGEWALLEIGTTVRQGVPNYMLKRDALSIDTPDGKTIPLASKDEYLKVNLDGLKNRANVSASRSTTFRPAPRQPCRIGFRGPEPARAGLGSG
jgi:hypothetical protein